MPILDSVRTIFTRRRNEPVEELNGQADPAFVGTQADKLFAALEQSESARRATNPNESAARPPRTVMTIEPKPAPPQGLPAFVPPTPSTSARSHDNARVESNDVIGLVRRIGEHLDDQAQHGQQVVALLDRLPPALQALPEMNRHCTRLLEVITEAQQHSRKREDALNNNLERIGAANERHTEVLGLLQQQLDNNEQATRGVTDTLDNFRRVLSEMSNSTAQSVDVLSKMAKASEKREFRMSTTLAKTQKWMIATMIFCGVVSATAIGIALVTLFK